ncbi:MAG: hypothetical protein UX91_C0006G0038 [Candidatus Amesbacteria bacterium GW2011_GWB1_47_19]|nr:MAG: hypothetical protein UW51_C0002G0038 [Candidatus Amesbacteria bacterium GW2011_GWA1_44_24]KKU31371.1 MAG: hypothetical protein UX46_C0006G0163 [Candidatus Amesbacteria bacterium GW2011_GWC1_46_24]KKU66976.1 MAG: hypothetical protein UX91_C0006G0038 [Candidatus Amesbacteria bacterium GW2011_GWB1_47_19]OGD05690.1 MAG: hypothetical protein A2379_05595 [Candidatus Amesbacteria bacterium RIFOXYB1_FULL_47_13]
MTAKLPLLLFILSLLAFAAAGLLILERFAPLSIPASGFTRNPPSKLGVTSLPSRILLPEVGIDLPVYAADVFSSRFPATPDGVTFLLSTALPGQSGVSIMYGHNWPRLLKPLHQAKTGQIISITFANGRTRDFKIINISKVSPKEISALSPVTAADSALVLYTCTGFLDRQRLILTATPV